MKTKYKIFLYIFFYLINNSGTAQTFSTSNFVTGSDNIRITESIKNSDGIILLGDFLGTINRPQTILADGRDIFLANYDTSYNLRWIKHIGGTLVDLAQDIVVDQQNNIYVLGSFQGTCSFDGLSEQTSDGSYDVFIAKYSSTGIFQWVKKIAYNTATQYGSSIDFDGTNLIVGGYYTGSINFDSQSFTSTYGMYFAKFDLSGNFIWAKNIPTTTTSSTLQSVNVFSDGYYFNGRYRGTATFDLGAYVSNNASYTDVFLYKTDFNGTGQWLRRSYGDNNAFTGTMTQDNYGNVYFTGLFNGTNLNVDSTATIKGKNAIINQGSSDIFILKYNKSGKLIWSKGFGESGSDWARDIKYKNNAFYLTGYFSGTITFGTDVLTSSSTSDQDAFIGVLDSKGNTLRAVKIDDSNEGNESGMTVSVDDDNTVYWGGTFKSTTVIVGDSTFTNPNPGKQCVYMTKGKTPFSVAFSEKENPTCYQSDDGQLVITPYFGTAPYTYTWSHNGALNDSTATNLSPGTYSVTVTDALANTDEASYVLTEPDPITFNPIITNVSQCSYSEEGEIDLNMDGGNGGFTYEWMASNGGDGNTYSTEDQIGLATGTYHVTVTDVKECVVDTSIIITGPAPVTFNGSVVTDSSAINPGAINLSYAGGFGTLSSYTFNWSGPLGYSQTTEDIANLNTGNYTVTVTDVHSCKFDTTFHVLDQTAFYAYISDYKDACQGTINGNATASFFSPDGHTGITYQWDANAGNQTTAKAINLAAGNWYYVTVTDVENDPDISMVDSVYISQLGYTFSGSFSLASTLALHCFGDNDGFIDLNITNSGIRPYNYTWSTGATTQDLYDLGIGTYGVTVTDDNECRFTVTNYSITQPTAISAIAEVVNKPTCNGDYDGEVTVDRSGGTSPYTYQWNDPGYQDTRNADGLNAGFYTVTVADVNNCTAVSNVNLTEPNAIQVLKLTDDVNCYGGSDGSVSLTVSGGTTPFSYFWTTFTGSGLVPTDKNQSGLTASKYYYKATDANNCYKEDSVTLIQPPVIQITNEIKADVSTCNGEETGEISITSNGGTGLLSFTLNPGAVQTNNSGNFTGLGAGTYNVNVTDENGCGPITSSSLNILEPDPLVITQDKLVNADCYGANSGIVEISVSGGTRASDYNYTWTTSDGSGIVAGAQDQLTLSAGNYNLTVSDDNSCEKNAAYTLTEPQAININKTVYNPTCYSTNDGIIIITLTGGALPYSYLWTTPNGSGLIATNKNQGGLSEGKYYLLAIDANDCITEDSAEIFNPNLITIDSQESTDATSSTSADGSITVTASGGTSPLDYTLSPGNKFNTTGVFSGLAPGEYIVNVSDYNNCGPISSSAITIGTANSINDITIDDKIKIYPNPTSSTINIDIDLTGYNKLNMEVLSISGQVVYKREVFKDGFIKEEIDLSEYSKGLYFIRIYNNEINFTKKITLQ